MTRALYLLGAPAAGKTTVVNALVHRLGRGVSAKPVKLHGTLRGHPLSGDGLLLGVVRPGRSGTDGLSMAVMPDALAWLAGPGPDRWRLVLGEGARLGTSMFLVPLGERMDLTVVHLTVSPGVQAARMRARGSVQDPGWARGASTAAANAAARCADAGRVLTLDADTATPRELAATLLDELRVSTPG